MREELLKFVQLEVQAEELSVRNKHRNNVPTRVQKGNAIDGLRFVGVDDHGYLVYTYQENLSRYRAGDLLIINKGRPRGEDVLELGTHVWLEEIDYRSRLLRFDKDTDVDPPQSGQCIADRGFVDYNSSRLKQSIEIGYEREDIVDLIEGRQLFPPPSDIADSMIAQIMALNANPEVTERQALAIASAMTNPVTLIQGPPGSGKTWLLSLIMHKLLLQHKSILLVAPTHKAIDNALEKTMDWLCADLPIVKIKGKGKSHQLNDRILQTSADDPYLTELRGGFIIGATVYQAFKLHQNDQILFDAVFIDEAGQLPIAHAFPAFINAFRYIISGDHKQLPPIINAPNLHPEILKRSIFEHFHESYANATITLDLTFRMNEHLNEFPSFAFYEGKLKSSSSAAKRQYMPERAGAELDQIICRPNSITYVELEHRHARQRSPEEADLVARLARDLLIHHGLEPSQLAVISPHRAQNESIRAKLIEYTRHSLSSMDLLIDTVERLQGQERDVIIFSLCASDRQYAINNAGFLYSPNRMNVALTRSKRRLFIVGSKYFFPHLNQILIDAHHMRLWESYYEYLLRNDCKIAANSLSNKVSKCCR